MFVNRESELKELSKYLDMNRDILIYGLRGIGKTALLKNFYRQLLDKNISAIFLDGLKIVSPSILARYLGVEYTNPYDILNTLSSINSVILIDEFTTIFDVFSSYQPYRGRSSVARHFRSIVLERRERRLPPIIISSSALGVVHREIKKYFGPLFREFKHIFIGPLAIEDAAKIALKYVSDRNIAIAIAEISQGHPWYTIVLATDYPIYRDPKKTLENSLEKGDLNIYFTALYNALTPKEKIIVHIVSRGYNRYSDIEKYLMEDPTIYLTRLVNSGIIYKVKKRRKESYYFIIDKLFKSWLELQDIVGLSRKSLEKIFVSNISFEALIRELFINIVTPTEIRDEKGSIYILNPVKHVVKTNWSGIDIDVLAFIDENTVNIFECYFGEKAGIKKIRQILKASKIVLDRGYKINIAGCISYFGFKENILNIARKHNIALISKRQLKKIKEINGLKYFPF